MIVVEPYACIKPDINENVGVAMLQKIERIARVSHRSEFQMNRNSWERFIKHVVLDKGDWSVTEHCIVTVEAVMDRGITHEWVRHRLSSYTQESTRFVNYGKGGNISVIIPLEVNPEDYDEWFNDLQQAEKVYLKWLNRGYTPQIARSHLPHGIASMIITTNNLRSWRHFFLMRTTKEAHPQIKQIAIPLLEEFRRSIPLLFEDIEPNMRQAHNLLLSDGDNAK